AHFVEQIGKIGDFRLARTVLHHRFAFGQSGRHHQVFRAGDGDLVKNNVVALQTVGARFDVSMFLGDGGAQPLESFDVQVDRSRPNSTSAGEGNARDAHARDQG